MHERRLRTYWSRLVARYGNDAWQRRMAAYRQRPADFAREVLGSRWWRRQREVADALAANRRVAVKSANGVGKTYLAADLALWFLYTHAPSIVLTSAPTARQVRGLLWEEIRRRMRGARAPLPGTLETTSLRLAPGWFALGLATDEDVRFQGYHAEDLLIVFDEASGIPDEIWEAAEGVAVGRDNRILAIGNPLRLTGRFHALFDAGSGWTPITISALEHPNVTGEGDPIPGAVTAEAVDARVAAWCEADESSAGGAVVWRGRRFRPNNAFRVRVLGEFPDADQETLIPLPWVEAAMARTLPAVGPKRAAADIARFGGDSTVIGVRVGPVVVSIEEVEGLDLMAVAGRLAALAARERPETVAVDACGLGVGVVDRLAELGVPGIAPVNGAEAARDARQYANRRAETWWALRERLRSGDIALPPHEALREQLAALRYTFTPTGQIAIESKDELRRRGIGSPDHAEMLAMLFDPALDGGLVGAPGAPPANPLRTEMTHWPHEG